MAVIFGLPKKDRSRFSSVEEQPEPRLKAERQEDFGKPGR
jgi:hypothetical protein